MYIAIKDITQEDENGDLIVVGEYTVFPYSRQQLKKDNPNTSFPKEISEELLRIWRVFPVLEDPIPTVAANQKAIMDTEPTKVGDEWRIGYSVRDKTLEEMEEESSVARIRRDSLLKDSDWTHVTDSVLTDSQKVAWAIYRQALRDITNQAGFPYEITWPTKPA